MLREDIAPAWLEEPGSVEEAAERYFRPALRDAFINLCRGPVSHYLDKFGFRSNLLKAGGSRGALWTLWTCLRQGWVAPWQWTR